MLRRVSGTTASVLRYCRSSRFNRASISTCLRFDQRANNSSFSDASVFLTQALIASLSVISISTAHAEEAHPEKEWPVFRRAEIAKHNSIGDAWVTFQGNVYDITSFVRNHPGGHEKILLAAGGDIESYWNLYRQHYNSPTPMEVLTRLQIGVLHDDDIETEEKAKELAAAHSDHSSTDPYDSDPSLSPIMRVLSKQPINAEPPGSLLTDNYLTPNELFFIRNHHPVPQIDANSFTLDLSVQQGATKDRSYQTVTNLSLHDLRSNFPPVTVTTTVQCGGNRRLEMTELEKTNGASWQVSAISTATWTGASLRQVLLTKVFPVYGIQEEDVWQDRSPFQHVHFVGADGMEASIPLKKAIRPDGDVILAYKMNDADHIPPEHGFPLRVIVPGHVGVRNVKWVKELRLSHEEAYGTWQRGMAYKGFGPSRKSLDDVDVEAIPSLQEQPVTSAITSVTPVSHQDVNNTLICDPFAEGVQVGDKLHVQGYAYSGGGRGIVRVDVSADGGNTWQDATLTKGKEQPLNRAWAWTFWETEVTVPSKVGGCKKKNNGIVEIISKATDAAYNVQPDSVKGIWNLRGINNNAWHRVRLPLLTAVEDGQSSCDCAAKK